MIARWLAALVLGPSAVLAAVIGSVALSADWAWAAQWLVQLAGLVALALCFTAPGGLAAWGRGLVFAGVVYTLAAALLFAAPDAAMRQGGEAVAGAAGEVGRQAQATSTGTTAAGRAAEGAVAGALIGTMGLMGVAFGVVFLIGVALLAGGMHLTLGLILMLANRRQAAGLGG